jgi:DNA repair exonuclease SbcCD ATPase subunit
LRIEKKPLKKLRKLTQAFKNAGTYRYVPIVDTKRQFKENLNKIEQLKQKLSDLQSENNEGSLNLDDMQAARLREIRNDLSQLREQKNIYLSRLNVIKSNEEAGPKRYRNNYHELEQFFPDVDIQRIEKIDKFHHQITKFLKLEFEREKNTIEENVEDLSHHISQLVNEAQKIKNQQGPNVQTALLNEYADKKAELKQLEDENKNYQKKKKLQQDKKDQQDALKATINTELGRGTALFEHQNG